MKKPKLKLGLEVGFWKTFYLQGNPNRFLEYGTVEVVRKDTVLVRVRHGSYTREVLKKDLLVRNPNKPRRDGKGWLRLDG